MAFSDLQYTNTSVTFLPVNDAVEEGTDGEFELNWSISTDTQSLDVGADSFNE